MNSKTTTELIKEAKHQIENLTPLQLRQELEKENSVLIDIRESDELSQNGKIQGSVHAPRGMLEFYADENLPYHKPEFSRDNRILLYCV